MTTVDPGGKLRRRTMVNAKKKGTTVGVKRRTTGVAVGGAWAGEE
jgi:hypothetical protein